MTAQERHVRSAETAAGLLGPEGLTLYLSIMNRLSCALFVTRGDGCLILLNSSAHRLLDEGGPFILENEHLVLKADWLPKVGTMSDLLNLEAGRSKYVPLFDEKRFKAYHCGIEPIDLSPSESAFLLYLTDADLVLECAAASLGARFSFTSREQQVAAALLKLGGMVNVARHLSLSPHTVRTHVTRIFDKAGVRTQTGLLRLALENFSPFGAR